jgi:membrane protease YdiL (CAAX protease family)
MNKNPYAAPSAVVSDRPEMAPAIGRPKQVTIAVALLWIDLVIAFPILYLMWKRDEDHELWVVILAITLVVLAIYAAGIFFANRGKNWARLLILAFVIVTTLTVLLPSEDETPQALIETVLDYLSLMLEFAALYLLFSKPGALWFRAREQEPY